MFMVLFLTFRGFFFFFFNDTATTEIYTLSLHDALPISARARRRPPSPFWRRPWRCRDRKSTRLNSSHGYISYAVFCLKKKKTLPPALSRRILYYGALTRASLLRSV